MAKIILFRDKNFGKDALVCKGPQPNLKTQDFNDCTSSLIVIDGTWELCQDANYEGLKWTVSATGGPDRDGVYNEYREWNGKNDSISSLRPV